MDPSFILILVLAFAFAATSFESRFLGARGNLLSSLQYPLIGVLAGPLVLDVLDARALASLDPLLGVVTGFVGFLIGLPLPFSLLSKRSRGTIRFGLITALVTSGTIGVAAWLVFNYTSIDLDSPSVAALASACAALALGASVTAVESIRTGIDHARADGPLSRLVPGAAQTMRLVAVFGFGLSLAIRRGVVSGASVLGDLGWVGIEIGTGVALGLIFWVFVADEREPKKLFVATIGVVCLGSGAAEALDFSPLFVNLVTGVTLANVSPRAARRLWVADLRLRRPLTALLLIIAGAMWAPIPSMLWLVPAGYIVLRLFALRVGARLGAELGGRTIDRDMPRPGNALLAQGAVVAAIAIDFVHVTLYPMLSALVLTTLLVSMVVNELWDHQALRSVLQDAGETGRLDPSAPASREEEEDLELEGAAGLGQEPPEGEGAGAPSGGGG